MAIENVKKVLEGFLAPRLERLEGIILGLDSKIGSLESRISSLERGFDSRISSLEREFDKRLDSLEKGIIVRFDAVDARLVSLEREVTTAIDIHERLARVEAKLALVP